MTGKAPEKHQKTAKTEQGKTGKKEPELKEKSEQKQAEQKQPEQRQTEQKQAEQRKLDPKDEKIIDLTDTLQRLQAEFENFKKRCDRENAQYRSFANKDLIRKLLPILDSFELALKNKKGDNDFTKGVELLHAQLFSALESEGLKKMEAKGKKCDPMQHEVLLVQESGREEGTVLEEKVKISRAAHEKGEEKKGEKKEEKKEQLQNEQKTEHEKGKQREKKDD